MLSLEMLRSRRLLAAWARRLGMFLLALLTSGVGKAHAAPQPTSQIGREDDEELELEELEELDSEEADEGASVVEDPSLVGSCVGSGSPVGSG
jgi:hypothetical protein